MFLKSLTLLSLAAFAFATPRPSLPSGTVTCGDNRYSVSAITAAINAGVKDMDEGDFPDDYPHQYYE